MRPAGRSLETPGLNENWEPTADNHRITRVKCLKSERFQEKQTLIFFGRKLAIITSSFKGRQKIVDQMLNSEFLFYKKLETQDILGI